MFGGRTTFFAASMAKTKVFHKRIGKCNLEITICKRFRAFAGAFYEITIKSGSKTKAYWTDCRFFCIRNVFYKIILRKSISGSYKRLMKKARITELRKSANKLPTIGTSRKACTEGAYFSVMACIFAIALGVAPMPKPQVPAVSTAAS